MVCRLIIFCLGSCGVFGVIEVIKSLILVCSDVSGVCNLCLVLVISFVCCFCDLVSVCSIKLNVFVSLVNLLLLKMGMGCRLLVCVICLVVLVRWFIGFSLVWVIIFLVIVVIVILILFMINSI